MDDRLTLRLSPIVVARMSESEMRVTPAVARTPDFAALIRATTLSRLRPHNAIDRHGIGARSHRRHASHRGHAHRSRPLPAVSQAREREPLGLAQGPAG